MDYSPFGQLIAHYKFTGTGDTTLPVSISASVPNTPTRKPGCSTTGIGGMIPSPADGQVETRLRKKAATTYTGSWGMMGWMDGMF